MINNSTAEDLKKLETDVQKSFQNFLKLNAEAGKFKRNIENLSAGIRKIRNTFQNLSDEIDKAKKSFSNFKSIANSIVDVFKFVNDIALKFITTKTLSENINATIQEVEFLHYVAQRTGVGVKDLDQSLNSLGKAVRDAFNGIGDKGKEFERLGINIRNCDGSLRDTAHIFGELGQKLSGLERHKQLAILEKLGLDPKILPVITSDLNAFSDQFVNLYRKAGLSMESTQKSAQEFSNSLNKFGSLQTVLEKILASKLFESLGEAIDVVCFMIEENLPEIMLLMDWIAWGITTAVQIIIGTIGILASIGRWIGETAAKIVIGIEEIWDAIVSFFKKGYEKTVSVLTLIMKPFFLLFKLYKSVVSAFAQYFIGLWKWVVGVFTGSTKNLSNPFKLALEKIKKIWQALKSFFIEYVDWLGNLFGIENLSSIIGEAFESVINDVKTKWESLKTTIIAFINLLPLAIEKVAQSIEKEFDIAIEKVKEKFELLKKSISELVDWATQKWDSISEGAKELANSTGETIADWGNGIWNYFGGEENEAVLGPSGASIVKDSRSYREGDMAYHQKSEFHFHGMSDPKSIGREVNEKTVLAGEQILRNAKRKIQ